MHSGALARATKYFLQTYWSLNSEGEVKITPSPGRPLAMQGPWAITIHDLPTNFEGINGYYPRYGCIVTFSARLDGAPLNMLEDWLAAPQTGFTAVVGALTAFLHKWRYAIREWSDRLIDASPLNGIVTGMVEAPRPLNSAIASPRQPDWWGETVGNIRASSGNQPDSRTIGYSADIVFGGALTMQNESPIER